MATVSGVCLDRRQEELGVRWLIEIDVLLLVHSSRRAPLDVPCVAHLSYLSPCTTYQVLDAASVGSSSVSSSSVRFSLIVSTAGVARHGSAGRGWALVSRLMRCFLFWFSLSGAHARISRRTPTETHTARVLKLSWSVRKRFRHINPLVSNSAQNVSARSYRPRAGRLIVARKTGRRSGFCVHSDSRRGGVGS